MALYRNYYDPVHKPGFSIDRKWFHQYGEANLDGHFMPFNDYYEKMTNKRIPNILKQKLRFTKKIENMSPLLSKKIGGRMAKISEGIARKTGNVAKSFVGLSAAFGVFEGVSSYDKTKSNVLGHSLDTAVETIGTFGIDMGAMELTGALLNPVVGIGALVGASFLGLDGHSLVGSYKDRLDEDYDKATGRRNRSITQNKQTMNALNQSAALLGQTTRHSMLGQEAQYFHN